MTDTLNIGIDVGGTKIELGLVDQNGVIVSRQRRPTPGDAETDPYDAFLVLLGAMIDHAAHEAGLGAHSPVGLCIPGALDAANGQVKNSNRVWMNGRSLQADLESRIGRKTVFANDGACFALSETMDGSAVGTQVVFGVVLGTGVGGGLVLDRQVWNGRHGISGEWGHNPFPVRDRSDIDRLEAELGEIPRCFCGQTLCVETVLRGQALAARYEVLSGRAASGAELASLIKDQDLLALKALQRYGGDLARALSVVVNLVDPDVIVLGGGLSDNDALLPIVNRCLPDMVFHTGPAKTRPAPRVLGNRWGGASGLRGAAWMARQLTQSDNASDHVLSK
ncbi:ROK family protein [Oceanicaulis alexandrii]|uniref:ROK family protein n=1 Tax=Oceanicaulis alexandrii TaxID=153233 RepID=UPI0035D1192C